MAVLIEGISVVVRRSAIDSRFLGGWNAFVSSVPNRTLCTDGEVARVGFMAPADVEAFIDDLTHGSPAAAGPSLRFIVDGSCRDIAVVDQQRGPTMQCDWMEFARIPYEDGQIAICWLYEGPRQADGIHRPSAGLSVAFPEDWNYARSLSKQFGFVRSGEEAKRLRFLRTEEGLDVFLDLRTGKEVFIGRTTP
jgi:hypothetical protein